MAEKTTPDDDRYSDEETARRRDATIRAMIATPPKPQRSAEHGTRKVATRKSRVRVRPTRD